VYTQIRSFVLGGNNFFGIKGCCLHLSSSTHVAASSSTAWKLEQIQGILCPKYTHEVKKIIV